MPLEAVSIHVIPTMPVAASLCRLKSPHGSSHMTLSGNGPPWLLSRSGSQRSASRDLTTANWRCARWWSGLG